ncbi:MAG TPA: hypothetical protein VIV63_08025 [Steroidobacteraceae bacterium]
MKNTSTLPLGLKIFLAAFSLTLIAYNTLFQGVHSLLYFCNVALFLGTIGICLERALPVAMAAVGVVMIQLLWSVDLALTAAEVSPVRMTAFMLNDNLPVFKKVLALFHAWLPFVLIFAMSRLGYDPRALVSWTVVTWALLLVSYLFLPRPPAPPDDPTLSVNINFVFGLNMAGPQQRMPELAWLGAMMLALPLLVFLPSHFVFKRLFGGEPAAVTLRTS